MKAIGYALAAALTAAPITFAPEPAEDGRTREPALAGSWYPEGRAHLLSAAHLLMRVAAPGAPLPVRPVALVVPHAGWNYSGPVAGTAFHLLKPGDFGRVVVMGPSHHQAFRGYAIDDARAYRTPAGAIPLCDGAFAALQGAAARPVPAATSPEHSVEIELPFLQAALGRFCLVPIVVGETSAEQERAFAARLAKLDDGRTLFVFSSDFSHYGPRFDYQPFGALSTETYDKVRALNERATAAARFRRRARVPQLPARDGEHDLRPQRSRDDAGAAAARRPEGRGGHARPLRLDGHPRHAGHELRLVRGDGVPARAPGRPPSRRSRRRRSSRTRRPRRRRSPPRPGRASCGWRAPRSTRSCAARTTSRASWRASPRDASRSDGRASSSRSAARTPPRSSAWASSEAASASRSRRSRSTTAPCRRRSTRPSAIRASSRCRRPSCAKLEVEVTVLSPRREIASYREIRIGTHGVVLEKNGRAALFLPQVAPEQGWNVEQMLEALAEKAGLPKDAWREGAKLSVFTGQVFEEH